jgi:hypothetical protein
MFRGRSGGSREPRGTHGSVTGYVEHLRNFEKGPYASHALHEQERCVQGRIWLFINFDDTKMLPPEGTDVAKLLYLIGCHIKSTASC